MYDWIKIFAIALMLAIADVVADDQIENPTVPEVTACRTVRTLVNGKIYNCLECPHYRDSSKIFNTCKDNKL